jgi:hypothetical protein
MTPSLRSATTPLLGRVPRGAWRTSKREPVYRESSLSSLQLRFQIIIVRRSTFICHSDPPRSLSLSRPFLPSPPSYANPSLFHSFQHPDRCFPLPLLQIRPHPHLHPRYPLACPFYPVFFPWGFLQDRPRACRSRRFGCSPQVHDGIESDESSRFGRMGKSIEIFCLSLCFFGRKRLNQSVNA